MPTRRAFLTDHATDTAWWVPHGSAAGFVQSDPLRYSAVIGRERAPLLRNPFTAPHHIQIADCHYLGAA